MCQYSERVARPLANLSPGETLEMAKCRNTPPYFQRARARMRRSARNNRDIEANVLLSSRTAPTCFLQPGKKYPKVLRLDGYSRGRDLVEPRNKFLNDYSVKTARRSMSESSRGTTRLRLRQRVGEVFRCGRSPDCVSPSPRGKILSVRLLLIPGQTISLTKLFYP